MSNDVPGRRTRFTRVGARNGSQVIDHTLTTSSTYMDPELLHKAALAMADTGRRVGATDEEIANVVAMLGVTA